MSEFGIDYAAQLQALRERVRDLAVTADEELNDDTADRQLILEGLIRDITEAVKEE